MTLLARKIFAILLFLGLAVLGLVWQQRGIPTSRMEAQAKLPTQPSVLAQPTPSESPTPTPYDHLETITSNESVTLGGRKTAISWSPQELIARIKRNQQLRKESSQNELLDLTPFWQDIKMSPGMETGGLWEQVQVQIVPLDHDPGNEWLIILHGYTPHLRRYLAFKQVGHKQWQFLGGLDYTYFNGHFFSEHKLLHIGGKPYLWLRTTTGSGTGYYRYDMNLFALGAENFREVLHYIESEQMAGGPALSRVNSSQYLPPNGRENIFKVRFTRSVESAPIYPHCETTKLLNFTKSRLISFMWSAEAQKFVFNAQKSGITEEQFHRSFQDTDYESVLADRYDVLLQVARGNSVTRKACVREFIEDCDDSPIKQRLLQALGH